MLPDAEKRIRDAEHASRFRPRDDDQDMPTRWTRDGPAICLRIYRLEEIVHGAFLRQERAVDGLRQQRESLKSEVRQIAAAVEDSWPDLAASIEQAVSESMEGRAPDDRARSAVAMARGVRDAVRRVHATRASRDAVHAGIRREKSELEAEIPAHERDNAERRKWIKQLESRQAGLRDDLDRTRSRYAELQREIDSLWSEAITLLRRRESEMAAVAVLERYVEARNAVGREDPYFEARIEEIQEAIEAERRERERLQAQRMLDEEMALAEERRESARARSIGDLPLMTATRNALLEAGFTTAGQLADCTKGELREIPGIGEARLEDIDQALWSIDLGPGW